MEVITKLSEGMSKLAIPIKPMCVLYETVYIKPSCVGHSDTISSASVKIYIKLCQGVQDWIFQRLLIF